MASLHERHVMYDDCDAALHGSLWTFQCGFTVPDQVLMRELSGEQEERLTEWHRRHHTPYKARLSGDRGTNA